MAWSEKAIRAAEKAYWDEMHNGDSDIPAMKFALDAAAAVDGDAGWMPIETAPKDGTIVDLWLDIYASPISMGISHAFRVIECWYEEGKWVHRVESGAVKELNMNYITHWMLPPAPPSAP